MGVLRMQDNKEEITKIKEQTKMSDIQIHNRIKDEKLEMFQEDLKNKNNSKVVSTRSIDTVWDTYMNNGWIDGKKYTPGPFKGIKNAWKDKPCYIIGSGPDLKVFINQIDFDFLNNKHSIGINHVIESYNNFEWFFFLDRRFLKKTTYNLELFKGKIFSQNNTGISSKFKNVVRFRCTNSHPTTDISKGLYSSRFSGLAALNLAIISGANPIFMIGFGMGKDGTKELFHFRKKYQGVGQQPAKQFIKYQNVYAYFKRFKQWYPSIIHVTEGDVLAGFKKMNFKTFIKKHGIQKRIINKEVNILKKVEPKIVHLSFSNDIKVHADITRGVINNCYGNHSMATFNKVPPADLYITEHFISTNKQVNSFPFKNKTINIVHSMNCIPQGDFKCNITLTQAWKRFIEGKNVQNVRYIPGGINLEPYQNIVPSKNNVFGRLTRWSPGKIPSWWNKMVTQILEEHKNSTCLMFIQMGGRGRELLKHPRMIYDRTCKINDFKGDWLKRMGIYVHANGSFRETMSHSVIEAMAAGLPIIYLKEIAVAEVVGPAGIAVNNEKELKQTIIKLLFNKDLRKSYGALSKKRSLSYNINNTIEKFNALIKEMV